MALVVQVLKIVEVCYLVLAGILYWNITLSLLGLCMNSDEYSDENGSEESEDGSEAQRHDEGDDLKTSDFWVVGCQQFGSGSIAGCHHDAGDDASQEGKDDSEDHFGVVFHH